MTENSTPTLGLPKRSKYQNLSLEPQKPLPAIRIMSLHNSPIHQAGVGSFMTGFENEFPSPKAITPQWLSHRGMKSGIQTPKSSLKQLLDERTLTTIGQIVDDRQKLNKVPKKKHKIAVKNNKNGEEQKEIDNDLMIEKVETYLRNKGLIKGYKEKVFDKKLSVFEGVKTFVDSRKLFREPVKTGINLTPRDFTAGGNTFSNGFKLMEPTGLLQGDATTYSKNLSASFAFPEGIIPRSNTATRKYIVRSIDEKEEVPGSDEEGGMNGNEPYFKFKEGLIRKLQLFSMQEKVKDFTLLKMVGSRNGSQEIDEQKKEEEEDDDEGSHLVRKLIEHLQPLNVNDDENSNRIDEYKEMTDSKRGFQRKNYSMSSGLWTPEDQRTKHNLFEFGSMEDQFESEKVEPQIEMLQKAQEFKVKSNEILKTLRNTLVQAHKASKLKLKDQEDDNEDSENKDKGKDGKKGEEKGKEKEKDKPESFRTTISTMNDYLRFTPLGSPSNQTPSLTSKHYPIPTIASRCGKDSPVGFERTRVSFSKEPTPSPRVEKIMSVKPSPSYARPLQRTIGQEATKIMRTSQSEKFIKNLKESREKEKMRIFKMKTKQKCQSSASPKRMLLKQSQDSDKEVLANIYNNIETLSVMNKQLNTKLKASIKQVDASYAKQKRMYKNLDIPEALQHLKPTDYVKSSSKLARNLAEKLYWADKV